MAVCARYRTVLQAVRTGAQANTRRGRPAHRLNAYVCARESSPSWRERSVLIHLWRQCGERVWSQNIPWVLLDLRFGRCVGVSLGASEWSHSRRWIQRRNLRRARCVFDAVSEAAHSHVLSRPSSPNTGNRASRIVVWVSTYLVPVRAGEPVTHNVRILRPCRWICLRGTSGVNCQRPPSINHRTARVRDAITERGSFHSQRADEAGESRCVSPAWFSRAPRRTTPSAWPDPRSSPRCSVPWRRRR